MALSRPFRKQLRDQAYALATFWKRSVMHQGVRLSLRGASARVRYRLGRDYELDDTQLCKALLRPGDRVLEVGSAVGFLALYCTKVLGIRDYATVEANPALAPIMAENFRLNGVALPVCINAAIGATSGITRFNVNRDYVSSSLAGQGGTAIEVVQRTIPDILDALPFQPNVLIMDIEGAEVDLPLAHLCRFEKISAEFHGRWVGQERVDRLLEGLQQAGFRIVAREGWSLALTRVPLAGS
jgi:FkbM family methyltransferase